MICMFIDGVEPQAKAARSSYGPAGGSALPASEVPAEAGRGGGGNDGTDGAQGAQGSKGNRGPAGPPSAHRTSCEIH